MSRSSTDRELHLTRPEYSNENLNHTSPSAVPSECVARTEGMVAPSKEMSHDNAAQITNQKAIGTSSPNSDNIFNVIYSIAKKMTMVAAVYLVGYMNWSTAWLITPVILSVTREFWQKSFQVRREIAKASATANEKDVILARMNDLPAWVYFPDVERCEWVNRILQQVWPSVNHYAKDLVKEVIEPKVAEALACWCSRWIGFKFDRILLGTISPRIGGIKVYDKNTARNEIILDMDLFYASDCDINFQLAGMRGGIKDFQMHGTIRVIMKPLISKIPLVGGLQIFFLNNPDIDFNLVGVADLLDMPGVSDMRHIISEQIGAIMVLPNKLPISLSNEVPSIALKMPEPEGILRINVVEAKNLMIKDISILGKGSSDPYAIVTVGSQQFRTKRIENTLNPKWNYWCEAIIQAEVGQYAQINLFDKDVTSDDEILGRATVEISSVVKNGHLDTWIPLEAAEHGKLHVRLTWLELTSSLEDLQAALNETQMLRVTNLSSAILIVYVDSAIDLPQAPEQCKPDPYVILTVGEHNKQTSALKRTDAPVWEQGFTFLVANPANDTLQLRIVDQKSNKELGQLYYVMSLLLSKPNLQLGLQPFQLPKSGPTSKVIISLAIKILKKSANQLTEPIVLGRDHDVSATAKRQTSVQSQAEIGLDSDMKSVKLAEFPSEPAMVQISKATDPLGQELVQTTAVEQLILSEKANPDETAGRQGLRHRSLSSQSSMDSYTLGRIQIALHYSVDRQCLSVTVHKIINIPLKDPSNVPDPYVKLYLLPGRSKETKHKTSIVKDSCNPVYDTTFEYILSTAELNTTELEITVATQRGFLSGGSPIIGMVKISLNDPEIDLQGIKSFYDLLPESKFE